MNFEFIKELEQFECIFNEESDIKSQFIEFVKTFPNCFDRELQVGHITSSAFIFDSNEKKVLLIHHKKLDKWLQPGGHCDGEVNTLLVAQKEVLEETGLEILLNNQRIFDLDIHTIPERGEIPEHLHFDVRYLFETSCRLPIIQNHETNNIVWLDILDLEKYTTEISLLRMKKKIELMKNIEY